MSHFQQGWNLQYKYYTMYMQHSYTQIEQELSEDSVVPQPNLNSNSQTKMIFNVIPMWY